MPARTFADVLPDPGVHHSRRPWPCFSCGGTPLPAVPGWDYAVPTMFEGVPAALRPPVALALAKAVESIPHENALPGGSVYEMKWDGFRAVCLVGTDGVSLFSRQNKDLGRYFPEVLAAVAEQVPPGCVVDGELVLWSGGRLDFDALQLRLVTARAALPALVRDHPASFVAFDVLAVAGHDTRGLPFTDRRALLEELARHWVPPLNLSPVTRDRAVAETWFKEMTATGVEGILAKAGAQAYEPRRIWLKVKARNVTDVVCAAVVGPMARPETVVVGLPMRGRLRIVGRSTALSARAGRDLAPVSAPAAGGPSVAGGNQREGAGQVQQGKRHVAPDSRGAAGRGGFGRRRLVRACVPAPRAPGEGAPGAGSCRCAVPRPSARVVEGE